MMFRDYISVNYYWLNNGNTNLIANNSLYKRRKAKQISCNYFHVVPINVMAFFHCNVCHSIEIGYTVMSIEREKPVTQNTLAIYSLPLAT